MGMEHCSSCSNRRNWRNDGSGYKQKEKSSIKNEKMGKASAVAGAFLYGAFASDVHSAPFVRDAYP